MDDALIALAHVVEPDDHTVAPMVERYGAVEAITQIAAGVMTVRSCGVLRERLRRFDAEREKERAARIGARIITRDSAHWPQQLNDLGPGRPYALWVLGAADLRLTLLRSISVVGARASTPYGEEVARSWCGVLVERGITIVSGGAFGIDAVGHRTALACDGMTICVLASGVDIAYPQAHEALIARIADEGLVVSESPIGEAVRRHRFLTRNRLIAALTSSTLIVEAALRSGTTKTAHAAASINRSVFAVPGPVTSPNSAGCHRLIAEGVAQLVDDPGVLVDGILGLGNSAANSPEPLPFDDLTPVQMLVLDAMPGRGVIDPGELAVRAGVRVTETLGALGRLEAMRLVAATENGWRILPRA